MYIHIYFWYVYMYICIHVHVLCVDMLCCAGLCYVDLCHLGYGIGSAKISPSRACVSLPLIRKLRMYAWPYGRMDLSFTIQNYLGTRLRSRYCYILYPIEWTIPAQLCFLVLVGPPLWTPFKPKSIWRTILDCGCLLLNTFLHHVLPA